MLSVAKAIRKATDAGGNTGWVDVITEAEVQLAQLLADGFGLLAGLTSSLVADYLSTVKPVGERLAQGQSSVDCLAGDNLTPD